MPKYAIYAEGEWIKDIDADNEIEAISHDPKATRAVEISETDKSDR